MQAHAAALADVPLSRLVLPGTHDSASYAIAATSSFYRKATSVPGFATGLGRWLDDSPLWDGGMPVESPELNTYLCLQEEALARIAQVIGLPNDARSWADRADRLAQRMIDLSVKYTGERQQFGGPIANQQIIQFYLAEMASKIFAMESMVYRTAAMADKGEKFSRESAMVKSLCTDWQD